MGIASKVADPVIRSITVFIAILALTGVASRSTLEAQAKRIAPYPSSVFAPEATLSSPYPGAIVNGTGSSTYAVEGLLLGAAVGGTALALVGMQHCESDCGIDKAALGFLVGAVLGAIPGLLIGGQFTKP